MGARTNLLGDFGVLITTLDHRILPLDVLILHDWDCDEGLDEGLFPFSVPGRGIIISMHLVDSRFLPSNVFSSRTCSQSDGGPFEREYSWGRKLT